MTNLLQNPSIPCAPNARASAFVSASPVPPKWERVKSTAVLVPFDFSSSSCDALDLALRMAKQLDTRIVLLQVLEEIFGSSFLDSGRRRRIRTEASAQALVALQSYVLRYLDDSEKIQCVVRHGLLEHEVLHAAEMVSARLIILGHRRLGLFRQIFFGSPTLNIIECAPCPVLVVNQKQRIMEKLNYE